MVIIMAKNNQKLEFLKISHFENYQKKFFSKKCFKLYLLIIVIIKIEVQNVWFFPYHPSIDRPIYAGGGCWEHMELVLKWVVKFLRNLNFNISVIFYISLQRGWGQNRVHPPSVRKINITIMRTLFSVSMASYQPNYMGFNQKPNFRHPRVTPGRPW